MRATFELMDELDGLWAVIDSGRATPAEKARADELVGEILRHMNDYPTGNTRIDNLSRLVLWLYNRAPSDEQRGAARKS